MKINTEFVQTIARALNLAVNVTFRISRRRYDACAEYLPEYSDTGKLIEHQITLYAREIAVDQRSLDVLIAHELIHAWQEENRIVENHGPHFAKMARKIGRTFRLRQIYCREIDEA